MNLVNDPWIPVVLSDGSPDTVGLSGLFQRAEAIRDLSVDPPRRVALTRLLICIAQAALDGPRDDEDWYECRERISPESVRYLDKWAPAFELRDANPFMQVPGLAVDEGKEAVLDKLNCRLSSGNNATLFDHGGAPDGRCFDEAENALNLLTYLNFSTGGKVGQVNWKGKKYSDSTFAAPCIKSAHTIIRGGHLLETLFFNLLTRDGDTKAVSLMPNGRWGRPVWEQFPKSVNDSEAFENAARTYLGRLVPLSRFVNLGQDRSSPRCIIGPTHKAHVIEHLPAFREPSTTVIQNKKGDEFYLPLSSDKHMWRQLGAVLSLKQGDAGTGGAMPLAGILTYYDGFPETLVDIWVGGLETGAQAAKISDMLEWSFQVPVAQLQETHLEKYQKGVELADRAEFHLTDAVKEYFKHLKKDPKGVPTSKARHRFWSDMDQQYEILLADANDPMARLADRWYDRVRAAMTEAYAHACPSRTPRQIQAYALGLKQLRLKKPAE